MDDSSALSPCPGCGQLLPSQDGPTHPYLAASPACWALYGEVLAREYSEPSYFRIHQLTVDTYAVQHPGLAERRATQSVGLHLMTLCLFLEDGVEPREGPTLHKSFSKKRRELPWLKPPQPNGRLTVADVHRATSASEHERLVRGWARDVWSAWADHHVTVRGWIDRAARDESSAPVRISDRRAR